MKVVLFCGGLGMRLYPTTENTPKPLVTIGEKPILWHLMRFYAHFGHRDFVLCLGYKADHIKRFFLNYDECLSNDFVLSKGGKERKVLRSDLEDWKITFLDTGLHSNVGQRLRAARKHLEGEEMFLANYTDALSDLPLPKMIDFLAKSRSIGCFLAVRPFHTFHVVSFHDDGVVDKIQHIGQSDLRINGGFFVFRKEIFEYIEEGEDLVDEPFQRLIERRQLLGYKYDGFWANMDTFKDKQYLDDLAAKDEQPWQVWRHT